MNMKKQTRRKIFIFLSISLFFIFFIFIIFSDFFILDVKITKNYRIKQVPFTSVYNLYDGDSCIVKGIYAWIIDKEFIHGNLKNSEYSYFIYNHETKEIFYFTKTEIKQYYALLSKWSIRDLIAMGDNISNYVWHEHLHLNVEEQEKFMNLSTALKIEKIIETCAGKDKIGFGPKFYDYLNLFTDKDEKEMISILLEKLSGVNVKPIVSLFDKTEYDIIYRLCVINQFFTTEDKQKFLSILEKKLDTYLKEYKLVDEYVVELDYRIKLLKGIETELISNVPDESLLKKYIDMGYKNLKIKE